jgi:hypothetical protein
LWEAEKEIETIPDFASLAGSRVDLLLQSLLLFLNQHPFISTSTSTVAPGINNIPQQLLIKINIIKHLCFHSLVRSVVGIQ